MDIIKKVFQFKLKPKRKDEKPKLSMPTRAEFLASYRNQTFSLPNSIIYYIARNPQNPKSYQKWTKVCKYFFVKNPILILESLCLGTENQPKLPPTNSSTKIWISGGFLVLPESTQNETFQTFFSSIISKLYYKSQILRLILWNVSINFDEFSFLSSSAKRIILNNVEVKYRNGRDVELEKLVSVSSNVKEFEYTFPSSSNPSNFSSKTIKNLIKTPQFLKMERCCLKNIPDTFNIKPLIEFLKTNDLYVVFEFSKFLSNGYRNQLNEIVFDVLESDAFIFGPPSLTIPGIEFETQMSLLRKARYAKN